MNEETKVILDTSLAEPPNAAEVLLELCQVLTRRGCALVSHPDGTILCMVTAANGNAGIGIANIAEIKPGVVKYKPIQFGGVFKKLVVQ